MKKIILLSALSFSLFSCGSVSRTWTGSTEKNLIKTVSIEQNCSKENIKIVDRIKRSGGATYSIEACGKRYVYKQVGSVFMEATKAKNLSNSLTK